MFPGVLGAEIGETEDGWGKGETRDVVLGSVGMVGSGAGGKRMMMFIGVVGPVVWLVILSWSGRV